MGAFLDWIRRVGKQVKNFFVKAGKMAIKIFRGVLRTVGKAIPIARAVIAVAMKIPGLSGLAATADGLLTSVEKGVKIGKEINKGLVKIGV